MPSRRNKVALVGSATSSKALAPWGNPEFEVWYLAWRSDNPEKADRYFDMHDLARQKENVPKDYFEHLKLLNRPVYSSSPHPDVPNSLNYPIEEILKFFGGMDPDNWDGKYFSSSIAYMLALAIYEEFDEIHLYGIDLLADGEWAFQRPNVEYLIGIARGMGRKVFIPESSALVKFNHLYGYQDAPTTGLLTRTLLEHRKKQYQEKHNKNLAEAYTADGARQEVDSLLEMLSHLERGGSIVAPAEQQAEIEERKKDAIVAKARMESPEAPKQEQAPKETDPGKEKSNAGK